MKAAVLRAPNDLRVIDIERPTPGNNEMLIQVRAAGICNSDLARVSKANVPQLPLVLGHEFSGVVVEVGEGCEVRPGTRCTVYPLLWCGRCASCRRKVYECCTDYTYHGSRIDGGMAEFVATRAENLVLLPDGVSDEDGAMTEPAAVAVHALNRADLHEGDRAVVLGAGPIGLIAAQVARARGAASVVVVDLLEEKLQLARELGFEKLARADSHDIKEEIIALSGGEGGDVVLEAAGHPDTYNLALDVAAPTGRVVFIGNIRGDLNIPQARVSAILRKQLTLLGTWNSSLARPENEWAAVHGMVARGEIDLASLISHRISLEEVPDVIGAMRERREPFQKVIVRLDR